MVEEDLLLELSRMAVTSVLTTLKENGELGDFIQFAKEQAKKDGMDSDEFISFLDKIGEMAEDEELYDWKGITKALDSVLPSYKVYMFYGDKTIAIENELITDAKILANYCDVDVKAPLNIETLNGALEPIGYKLEFMEALNLPFKLDEIQNFLRFKVKKLETERLSSVCGCKGA